jgi:hypothetical protein
VAPYRTCLQQTGFHFTIRSALHQLVRTPRFSEAQVLLTTMASADFSVSISWNLRSPQVRTYSFLRFLRHLPKRDCWLRALQRCAYLPSLFGLRMPFLFVSTGFCSLASFTVCLTATSLRLANSLHQLACKGLSPSGIIWYLRYQMPMLGTHST